MSDHIQAIEKALRFCNSMGIDTLRVDTISPPNHLDAVEYDKRFSQLAKTWQEAARVCQNAGVKLVWEFEPGFWLNKPSEVISIVEATDHDNFKVLFDTSHAYMCAVVGARQNGDKEVLPGGVVEFAEKLKGQVLSLTLQLILYGEGWGLVGLYRSSWFGFTVGGMQPVQSFG